MHEILSGKCESDKPNLLEEVIEQFGFPYAPGTEAVIAEISRNGANFREICRSK